MTRPTISVEDIPLNGFHRLLNGHELVVLVLFGAYAVFIGGAQVLQLFYPNELFPMCFRRGDRYFAVAGRRGGRYLLVPISLQTLGIGNTLYVAALVTFIGLLAAGCLAPETRTLNLRNAAALSS